MISMDLKQLEPKFYFDRLKAAGAPYWLTVFIMSHFKRLGRVDFVEWLNLMSSTRIRGNPLFRTHLSAKTFSKAERDKYAGGFNVGGGALNRIAGDMAREIAGSG